MYWVNEYPRPSPVSYFRGFLFGGDKKEKASFLLSKFLTFEGIGYSIRQFSGGYAVEASG